MIGKGTGRLRNLRRSKNHRDYSIIKTGRNTEKSPGVRRKLLDPVINQQLILV